ncbi:MAG: flagellar FliJ family protein [Marmoricola sp.]
MSARHQAGLAAVARVRSVRESDSRIGLQTALAEQRGLQARVEEVRGRLERANRFEIGTAAEFLTLRTSLEVLGDVLLAVEAERDQAATISQAALARWHADKARLEAIEMLIERRVAARRAVLARHESLELDDIAAQRWLRAREERAGAER